MNLMDCLMDEFQDEAKIAQLEEREIITWLEASTVRLHFIYFYQKGSGDVERVQHLVGAEYSILTHLVCDINAVSHAYASK